MILASRAGTVTYSGWQGLYGYCVEIDHGDGFSTLYAQCRETLVEVNDVVEAGAEIAIIGNSGNSFGRHLHFEVKINGERVEPLDYITFPDYFTPNWLNK